MYPCGGDVLATPASTPEFKYGKYCRLQGTVGGCGSGGDGGGGFCGGGNGVGSSVASRISCANANSYCSI